MKVSIGDPTDPSANGTPRAAFSQGPLGSSARAFRDEALLSPLSIGGHGLRGYQPVRSPGALRLHPAFMD
jgi:hypothetical protein